MSSLIFTGSDLWFYFHRITLNDLYIPHIAIVIVFDIAIYAGTGWLYWLSQSVIDNDIRCMFKGFGSNLHQSIKGPGTYDLV